MSHEVSPTGREPAEGYAAANSPWAAPPEPDEHQSDTGGPARARAQVPQARGSAAVPPPPGPGPAAPPGPAQPPPGPGPVLGHARVPGTPAPPGADQGPVEPGPWQAPPAEPAGWSGPSGDQRGWRQASGEQHAGDQPPWQPPADQGAWQGERERPGPYPPVGPEPNTLSNTLPPAYPSADRYAPPAPPPSASSGSAAVPPANRASGPTTGRAQVGGPREDQPGAATYGRRPDDRPVSGTAGVPPATTAFPAAYGSPADAYGQTEQYQAGQTEHYGPPPYGPAQPDQYGQTQQFGGAPYGPPSGAYPAQPSNVYGTASAPPATGYDRFDGGYGRYDETGPAAAGGAPAQNPPKRKRMLLILAVVGAVTILAAVVTAVVLATGSGTSFAVGDCVKQSGKRAVKASCTDSTAYKVVNDVSKQSECPDHNQPMVIVTEGKTQHVLCLRPVSQK